MRKKLASVLLAICLFVSMFTVSADAVFTDISDNATAVAVATLQSMGIVTGTSATTYSPNDELTRAQFCTLAVRAMGLEDSAGNHAYKTLFTDVKPGNWYTGYVNLAYSEGIISGYGNGRFGPDDNVTYGQVVTILLHLLGYTSDEVGKIWPADYVNYAKELGLNDGVSLGANSIVSRGDAAKLLYNTIKTDINGGSKPYYETIKNVASTQSIIVLDNNASSSGASGYLMACAIGSAEASIEYYPQKNTVSSDLVGYAGALLLNSAGRVIGFVPDSSEYTDLTISSAKASGITDTSGKVYRVTGSARVICNGNIYTYGSTGYIQVNGQVGKKARLFYNDDGAVSYVYIASGTTSSGTQAIVADTNSAASELARRLGISSSSYSITKNGAPATAADLAQYDVAYYDSATKTMCVSDYRISGYIEAASPSVDAAQTVTIAGCTLNVLECAWDTLGDYTLGSYVTLLLTDDNKVAAVLPYGKSSPDMIGVLSTDGSRVTLCGSGLVLTANTVSASESLRGSLVKVSASSNRLVCFSYSAPGTFGQVNFTTNTVGSYNIAPGCVIYEWAGSSDIPGYVYSLSGEQGVGSTDFSDIIWTQSLSSTYVSYYRLNSAGQVDILLLKDVTGNCYAYGYLNIYSDQSGINLGGDTMTAYNNAATITNSVFPAGSAKYLCTIYDYGSAYSGIALGTYSSSYQRVTAISRLASSSNIAADRFVLDGDTWYVSASGYEIPVSSSVEVYISSTGKWAGGESALLAAISSGMTLTVYYDRTLTTGAQVRVIVAQN